MVSNSMALEICAANCEAYNFFGVEYGREVSHSFSLVSKTAHTTSATAVIHVS